MQLILLGLVLGILMHDSPSWAGGVTQPWLSWPAMLAIVFGPKLLLAGGYYGLCRERSNASAPHAARAPCGGTNGSTASIA